MEQILNNIMEQLEQQQSNMYQGSGSRPQQASQQSHQHAAPHGSTMHMEGSKMAQINSTDSTTRELATPEQMQILKLLANQQLDVKQPTPQAQQQSTMLHQSYQGGP